MTKNQNSKQLINQRKMAKKPNQKQYDLEDRTFSFAKNVRIFVKKVPRSISNIEDGKQLVR